MTIKEFEVQFALGTLTPLKLFLKMLSMQNEDTIESGDWCDNRNPDIEIRDDGDIQVMLANEIMFVFNSKEEYEGICNYRG